MGRERERERERERKRERRGEEGGREGRRERGGETGGRTTFSAVYMTFFYLQCSTLSTTLMMMCLLVLPLGVGRPFALNLPFSGCFQLHLTHAVSL